MISPILNRQVRRNRSGQRKLLGFESLEIRAVLSATIFVPTDFDTIQEAVDAAEEGDKIRVLPGIYEESVTIDKDNLEIKSSDELEAIVTPDDGANFIFFVDGAKNVKIEGFTVSGPFTATTDFAGIQVSNGSAKIKNNLITQIRNEPLIGNQEGIGILVFQPNELGTARAVIEDNVISDYHKGGIVVSVGLGELPIVAGAKAHAEIEDNVIIGAGLTGAIAQNGIQISDKATAEIEDNRISGNFFDDPDIAGSAGILITDFAGPTEISKNRVFDNQIGIWVIDTTDVEVEKNKVYDNSEGGIFVDTSSNVEVTKNDVFDNEFYGISLFEAEYVEVSQNDVYDNGLNGISLLSSSHIVVSKNEVYDNGFAAGTDDEGAGILLFGSSNNHISNNEVSDNFLDGIALFSIYDELDQHLTSGSTDNTITRNEIEDNGGAGVFLDLDSVDNFIAFNEFDDNAGGAWVDVSDSNTFWKNKKK